MDDGTISIAGAQCLVLYKFPVLHEAWEIDYEGWVVEDAGERKLVLSNHTTKYFASPKELEDKMNEYRAALIKSATALSMVTL